MSRVPRSASCISRPVSFGESRVPWPCLVAGPGSRVPYPVTRVFCLWRVPCPSFSSIPVPCLSFPFLSFPLLSVPFPDLSSILFAIDRAAILKSRHALEPPATSFGPCPVASPIKPVPQPTPLYSVPRHFTVPTPTHPTTPVFRPPYPTLNQRQARTPAHARAHTNTDATTRPDLTIFGDQHLTVSF